MSEDRIIETDVAIIGAGTAGMSAYRFAASDHSSDGAEQTSIRPRGCN